MIKYQEISDFFYTKANTGRLQDKITLCVAPAAQVKNKLTYDK